MALKLKDGKFYNDGVLIPIEHGNKEQIALMNNKLNHFNALDNDGLYIDPEIEEKYTGTMNFDCSCGQRVYFDDVEADHEDEIKEQYIGSRCECRKCKTKYISELNDDGDLVVKILKEL